MPSGRTVAMIAAALAALAAIDAPAAHARTIHVNAEGTGDYPTLQAAVDAAVDGDTILCAHGTYTGEGNRDITVSGKSLTFKSAGRRDACVIDCQGSAAEPHWGFELQGDPSMNRSFLMEGLTITSAWSRPAIRCTNANLAVHKCTVRNNTAPTGAGISASGPSNRLYDLRITDSEITGNTADNGNGGGIRCQSQRLVVATSLVRGNSAKYDGGGLFATVSSVRIQDCTITENSCGSWGGGLAGGGRGTLIYRCTITGNVAGNDGGGWMCDGLSRINNCLVAQNRARFGGGIACLGTYFPQTRLYVTGCTLVDNGAEFRGGAMRLSGYVVALVETSIIRDNEAMEGRQAYVSNALLMVDSSNLAQGENDVFIAAIQGAPSPVIGDNVVDADADFVDPDNGDYRLLPKSPCVDAGADDPDDEPPASDLAGQARPLDGNGDGNARPDMGAYEFLPAGEAVIRVSEPRLYFTQRHGVLDASMQSVRIYNSGAGDVAFEIAEDCPWLSIDHAEGTVDANGIDVTVSVDPNGLGPDVYTCDVVVSADDALNKSATFTVILYVVPGQGFWVPFHYPTIQAALDACPEAQTVLVADGFYTGDGNRDIVFPNRAITLKSATGPKYCTIDAQGNDHAKHRGFNFTSVPAGARVDGFTVTGGTDNGGGMYIVGSALAITNCRIRYNDISTNSGAPLWCNSSDIRIQDSSVSCNVGRTGGVYLSQSTATITHCRISQNAAYDPYALAYPNAGGICAVMNSAVAVEHSTIKRNYMGGIFSDTGSLHIDYCVISGNAVGGGVGVSAAALTMGNSHVDGNTAENNGGAISCVGPGETEITDCTLNNNTAGSDGGGLSADKGHTVKLRRSQIHQNTVYGSGGGVACLTDCNLYIDNCTVQNNNAIGGFNRGGGIRVFDCLDTRISNSIISGNAANYAGGIHYLSKYLRDWGTHEQHNHISNCIISGNVARDTDGGGIYGGGTVTNCTIIGNASVNRGGAAAWVGRIVNCLIRDNRPASQPLYVPWARSRLFVTYCSFYGGLPGEIPYGLNLSGLHNMDVDPLFADPGRWDDNGTPDDYSDDYWVDGDYHLKSEAGRWDAAAQVWVYDDVTSPCIDAGSPGSALGDEAADACNVRINMGAYGGTAEASRTPPGWSLLADITNDGLVSTADLMYHAAEWMPPASTPPPSQMLHSDFNRDGRVTIADFATLAADWLERTSWCELGGMP